MGAVCRNKAYCILYRKKNEILLSMNSKKIRFRASRIPWNEPHLYCSPVNTE